MEPFSVLSPRSSITCGRFNGKPRQNYVRLSLAHAEVLTLERTLEIHRRSQNGGSRSNLALGNPFGYLSVFRIELFDGNTGTMLRTIENVSLPEGGWTQLNGILRDYSPGVQQGYARVTPVTDGNGFVTYGVLNDGAAPGERTGEGAFIASSP